MEGSSYQGLLANYWRNIKGRIHLDPGVWRICHAVGACFPKFPHVLYCKEWMLLELLSLVEEVQHFLRLVEFRVQDVGFLQQTTPLAPREQQLGFQ